MKSFLFHPATVILLTLVALFISYNQPAYPQTIDTVVISGYPEVHKVSDLDPTALPFSVIEMVTQEIQKSDPQNTRLDFQGFYDSVGVAGEKNSLMDAAGNNYVANKRAEGWLNIARQPGTNSPNGMFDITNSSILPSKEGPRQVIMYRSHLAPVRIDTVVLVVKDSLQETKMNTLQAFVDSIRNAGKETSNPFFVWDGVGLGYTAIFQNDGTQVPHGPTVYVKFATSVGVKIQLRGFGWGSYEGDGGLSGMLLLSYPIIGKGEKIGLDATIATGASSFKLKDGVNKIAPDRTLLYHHLMAGVQWKADLGAGVGLETVLLVGTSNRFGWTGDVGPFTMKKHIGALTGVALTF